MNAARPKAQVHTDLWLTTYSEVPGAADIVDLMREGYRSTLWVGCPPSEREALGLEIIEVFTESWAGTKQAASLEAW